jgi:hypothetical protein
MSHPFVSRALRATLVLVMVVVSHPSISGGGREPLFCQWRRWGGRPPPSPPVKGWPPLCRGQPPIFFFFKWKLVSTCYCAWKIELCFQKCFSLVFEKLSMCFQNILIRKWEKFFEFFSSILCFEKRFL